MDWSMTGAVTRPEVNIGTTEKTAAFMTVAMGVHLRKQRNPSPHPLSAFNFSAYDLCSLNVNYLPTWGFLCQFYTPFPEREQLFFYKHHTTENQLLLSLFKSKFAQELPMNTSRRELTQLKSGNPDDCQQNLKHNGNSHFIPSKTDRLQFHMKCLPSWGSVILTVPPPDLIKLPNFHNACFTICFSKQGPLSDPHSFYSCSIAQECNFPHHFQEW